VENNSDRTSPTQPAFGTQDASQHSSETLKSRLRGNPALRGPQLCDEPTLPFLRSPYPEVPLPHRPALILERHQITSMSLRRSPGLGRPGQRTKEPGAGRGCGGDPSARKLGRWCFRRWLVLIQPPRIAALLQLVDDVIGYGVPFILAQSLFQSADDLARPPQGKGDGVSKDFTSRHLSTRT
jgi:hypothetical protein